MLYKAIKDKHFHVAYMQFKSTMKNLLHPFLFAIFPVLFIFINNMDIIPAVDLILPLSIILSATAGLLIIIRIVLKKLSKSSLIVSLGIVLFFSYGHLYNLISRSLLQFDIGHHRYLLIPFITAFIIGTIYFVKTQRKLDNANIIATSISIMLVLIVATNFVFVFQPTQSSVTNESLNIKQISEQLVKPDIYYIILDAYGDAYTLQKYFNYNNSEFVNFLESKGFQASYPSFSNYPNTYLSLSSSLNMEYVHYLLNDDTKTFDTRLANDIINNNKVMQILKEKGYKIISFDSGWAPTRKLDIADLNLCGKNSFLDSEFLISIVDASILKPIYVKFFDVNSRDRIQCILSQLPQIGTTIDEPIFVFAHLLLPHPPYMFGPNGEAITPKSLTLVSDTSTEEKGDYLNQLKFTNKKIHEIVDSILSNSENPPVIIIQSDHGPPDSIFHYADQLESNKDKLRNINFYYLPTAENNIIYNGITPVNSFRIIIKNFLGEDLHLLEDRNYYIDDYDNSYKLIDITEELNKK